jgi:hypothetical protein
MSSLLGIMSVATGALGAEQGALDATTNNVANVNTPGYCRLQPVLTESEPVTLGSITYGTGVTLEKLQSLRDPILQLRIEEETQQQGQLNAPVMRRSGYPAACRPTQRYSERDFTGHPLSETRLRVAPPSPQRMRVAPRGAELATRTVLASRTFHRPLSLDHPAWDSRT